jgi:hypothetical protein
MRGEGPSPMRGEGPSLPDEARVKGSGHRGRLLPLASLVDRAVRTAGCAAEPNLCPAGRSMVKGITNRFPVALVHSPPNVRPSTLPVFTEL